MVADPVLLTRDEFREGTFARDKGKCLVCGEPAVDAHHIVERKLFGISCGYYIENGASVCAAHHLLAEQTLLSCDELRRLAGITRVVLPDQYCPDEVIDKWGDPILPNGMRLRGELFFEESVQKILAPVLHFFTDRVKFPRTFHFPWSLGRGKDDRVLESLDAFEGQEVVATIKMDGENTTCYCDGLHARSLDYTPHPSRNLMRALHARFQGDIPKSWRVVGENLYAKHSIAYTNLPGYFLVFSVWNDRNICLSWAETVEWAALLDLPTVPVLYRGIWSRRVIQDLFAAGYTEASTEGYVVRPASSLTYREYATRVGKMVRAGHVTTSTHWKHNQVEPNGLQGS